MWTFQKRSFSADRVCSTKFINLNLLNKEIIMKKSIIIISLIIGIASSAMAAKETVETPLQMEFADKLVTVFGGKDSALSERELVRVLDFLQANLPEKTSPTNMSNRLSRQNNVGNAPRGDLSDERYAIREVAPEQIAKEFITKYDIDKDKYVTKNELALALEDVIGTPKAKGGLNSGNLARN